MATFTARTGALLLRVPFLDHLAVTVTVTCARTQPAPCPDRPPPGRRRLRVVDGQLAAAPPRLDGAGPDPSTAGVPAVASLTVPAALVPAQRAQRAPGRRAILIDLDNLCLRAGVREASVRLLLAAAGAADGAMIIASGREQACRWYRPLLAGLDVEVIAAPPEHNGADYVLLAAAGLLRRFDVTDVTVISCDRIFAGLAEHGYHLDVVVPAGRPVAKALRAAASRCQEVVLPVPAGETGSGVTSPRRRTRSTRPPAMVSAVAS